MKNEKIAKRVTRKKRIRGKVHGTKGRPRLSVFRSNKGVYAQIINDVSGETYVSASYNEIKEQKAKMAKKDVSFKVGELLAQKAKAKKIKKVVFDRGGYRYHGRVESLAEGARKGGLDF